MKYQQTMEVKTVEPLCPVFGACGGCAYQHLPYEEELRIKGETLKAILKERLGLDGSLVSALTPSPEPYYSRSRLDLTLRRFKSGETVLGFMPPSGKKIVQVESCAIARREISDFIPELEKAAIQKLPPDYRNANLVVKTGDDGRVFWGGIGRHSLRMRPEDYLWTTLRGRRIYYSLETFFQANLSILPVLLDAIETLIPEENRRLLLDLYSGVGLFGIGLADLFQEVIMVEEHPGSAALARHNIASHGLSHVSVLEGRVEDRLEEIFAAAGDKAPVALIDPPRKGLSPAALQAVVRAEQIERLFYLSCHPESLARDLAGFLAGGWAVEKIMPFDFFPKTRHLETLVLLKPRPKVFPMKTLFPLPGMKLLYLQRKEVSQDVPWPTPGLPEDLLPLEALFAGGTGPLEVEIGCGKGKFLLENAAAFPDRRFLGIDYALKWLQLAAGRAQKRNLPNVRLIRAEAWLILEKYLPPASASVFHIYFPDPWHKRRHEKRRLLTAAFFRLLSGKLKPGGLIEIATDKAEYFGQIRGAVEESAVAWVRVRESIDERLFRPEFRTSYESKYGAQGRPLYYLELVK